MDTGAFSVSLYARVLSRFGGTTNGQHIPRGKPWDRQPVSGKLRRKLGVSPGVAAHFRPAFQKRLSTLLCKFETLPRRGADGLKTVGGVQQLGQGLGLGGLP